MKVLNSEHNPEEFFNRLAKATQQALLLDYDGTLAPFRQDRNEAVPYPGVRKILSKIITGKRTRLVVISGRQVKELVRLLNLDVLPEIWGCHGLERLTSDNEYHVAKMEETTRRGLAEVEGWIDNERLTAVSEIKASGVAFHWRGMDNKAIEKLREKIRKKWLSTAPRFGLTLREFDGGLELRVATVTKATAVRQIMEEMGPGAVLAYLGDDLTDEDAFQALRGQGLAVLVREQLRETAADVWIRPPEELLSFLRTWTESEG